MTSTLERSTGAPRTYGNWGRPPSFGLSQSLGPVGTGLVLGGMIAVAITQMFVGLLAASIVFAAVVLSLLLLAVRDRHHRNGLQRASTRVGWWRTLRRRAHVYATGPFGQIPYGAYRLPGLLASSSMTEWRDSYDRPFSVLHVKGDNTYCVTLSTDPDGASLVDQQQIDQWVAHYGQWLAGLGAEPGLVGASVTIETAPDSGTRLRREVESQADPRAHTVAQAMLREVVETYPIASSRVQAYVSLTFTGAGRTGKRRSDEEVAKDLAIRMPGITAALAGTGAGAVRPASATELCQIVHTAYNPSSARQFDAARAAGAPLQMAWSEVGPVRAEAGWDAYRHDSGLSMTWVMSGPPRGEVPESVITKLVAPHPDVDRKRVTLLYRPLDLATTARIVERDKRNADQLVANAKRPSARATALQAAVTQTAEEEARGAGLVNFALLITATVIDPGQKDEVAATIENLATGCRLTVRPVYGSQDTAFAAGLPLGLVTSRHLRADLRSVS